MIDKNFRAQIDNDRVFTCEKHFKEEDIETCKCQVLNNSCMRALVVPNKNNALKLLKDNLHIDRHALQSVKVSNI